MAREVGRKSEEFGLGSQVKKFQAGKVEWAVLKDAGGPREVKTELYLTLGSDRMEVIGDLDPNDFVEW